MRDKVNGYHFQSIPINGRPNPSQHSRVDETTKPTLTSTVESLAIHPVPGSCGKPRRRAEARACLLLPAAPSQPCCGAEGQTPPPLPPAAPAADPADSQHRGRSRRRPLPSTGGCPGDSGAQTQLTGRRDATDRQTQPIRPDERCRDRFSHLHVTHRDDRDRAPQKRPRTASDNAWNARPHLGFTLSLVPKPRQHKSATCSKHETQQKGGILLSFKRTHRAHRKRSKSGNMDFRSYYTE